MKKAFVFMHGQKTGTLEQHESGKYIFRYDEGYAGPPVSLTMPVINQAYLFDEFPPFFEGLLPEGILLEALLRKYKIDKSDYFQQLLIIGEDMVGAVTVKAAEDMS